MYNRAVLFARHSDNSGQLVGWLGFDFCWPLDKHVLVPWAVGRICNLSGQKGHVRLGH